MGIRDAIERGFSRGDADAVVRALTAEGYAIVPSYTADKTANLYVCGWLDAVTAGAECAHAAGSLPLAAQIARLRPMLTADKEKPKQ